MAEMRFSNPVVFTGMCDASAAVFLDGDRFAVADDESTYLHIYSLKQPGRPVSVVDLATFLKVDKKNPETDVEGVAQLGETIYWIGSHGRNKNGKRRESRERFFATKVSPSGNLVPVGRPYLDLLEDLTTAPQLRSYNLRAASKLAPKDPGALNIEALAPGENGSLLIGFRNPIPRGKALVVPLLNPGELVQDKNARARFGPPMELDLGGDGVRSILGHSGSYYIAAGAYDNSRRASIWKWDGASALVKFWQARDSDVNFEGLIEIPGSEGKQLVALSDDGGNKIEGVECKELPPERQRFRAFRVTPE